MKRANKLILLLLSVFSIATANAQEIKKWKVQDLEAAIKNADKTTIINFWATFCILCV